MVRPEEQPHLPAPHVRLVVVGGLDGTYLAFYVNPFKWSLENVGDDDARGEQLEIAPL